MAAWASEDEELHTAVRRVGTGRVLNATVEGIGETGWDWHVWDPDGHGQQYGLADTLEDAFAKAEQAMECLAGQIHPKGRPAKRMHADAGLR